MFPTVEVMEGRRSQAGQAGPFRLFPTLQLLLLVQVGFLVRDGKPGGRWGL